MRLLEGAVRGLSRIGEALASIATVLCLVLISASVFARYFFHAPQPWIDKSAGWLVFALVMLGAGEAQRRFEHIGVDIAVSRLGPRTKLAWRLVGTVSVAITGWVLLEAGIETVSFSRMIGLVTEVAEIPQWWVQLFLPLGAALLLVVALAQSLLLILGREPEYLPTGDEELPRDSLARGE